MTPQDFMRAYAEKWGSDELLHYENNLITYDCFAILCYDSVFNAVMTCKPSRTLDFDYSRLLAVGFESLLEISPPEMLRKLREESATQEKWT
jgi:hypothetical protein